MNLFPTLMNVSSRHALLSAVAVLGLAGCGSSPPVSSQAYPSPVYQAPAPGQPVARDYRRRESETLYEVPVSASRAKRKHGKRC